VFHGVVGNASSSLSLVSQLVTMKMVSHQLAAQLSVITSPMMVPIENSPVGQSFQGKHQSLFGNKACLAAGVIIGQTMTTDGNDDDVSMTHRQLPLIWPGVVIAKRWCFSAIAARIRQRFLHVAVV